MFTFIESCAGAYKAICDEENVQMIDDDCFEGLNMEKIAKKLNRSAASGHAQIRTHDEAMAFVSNVESRKGNMKPKSAHFQFIVDSSFCPFHPFLVRLW